MLQAMNNSLHGERAQDPIDADISDVASNSFIFAPYPLCDLRTSTNSFSSGPIRLDLSVLPKSIRIDMIG